MADGGARSEAGERVPVIPGLHDLVPVGRGGFGVVYRGLQPELGREIAVKVINTPGAPGSSVDRWRREITAMGRLSNHPNIVAVYSGGVTDDGSPYLVMPYVPGGSLRDRILRTGPLAPREVASFGARLAGALATAHEAGVLHRDVKPDNVLLSPYGEPQLTDFGIARLLDSTMTATSSVHATIPYAPPEVLAGQPATEAADVYGLGATLHACCTAAPPFPSSKDDSLVSLVGRIASQPPPDLRTHGVPDALASVIEQALAKTPEDRIPSADELRRRLEEVVALLDAPGSAADATLAVRPPGAIDASARGDEQDEHTSVMPVVPEAAVWADDAGSGPGPVADEPPARQAVAPVAGGRSSKPLIAIALLVAAVLGAAGLAIALNGDDDDPGAATGTTEPGAATTAPTEPPPSTETTEAPTTTEATTTTTTPTTTTTTPPTTEAPPPPAPAADLAGAATSYFSAIGGGDLRAAYGMFTPEFQAAQDFASFENFWGTRRVQVAGEPDVDPVTGRATVPLRNYPGGEFTLRLVERDGRWMVDGPRPG